MAVSLSAAIREYLTINPWAGPKAVIKALKAKGIDVKPGLVGSVKHHFLAQRTQLQAENARPTEKQGISTGTEAIRAYLKQHPKAGPKEIQTALTKQGVKVSKSLVSAVKYRKQKRAPALRMAARNTKPSNGALTVQQLIELKRFADSFGGLEHVRRGLDTLARLS